MLFYVPLEPYVERYTMQWSAPIVGWLERRWIEAGIEYRRVEGTMGDVQRTIKTGCVLDAVGRSLFSFSQIGQLLRLAEEGRITSKDVIYFDDFWTPGMEALPYAFSLMGIKPKMFAFLHAQSVDEFDFTYPMRHWMRHVEKAQGTFLDGIFVCGHTLKDLVVFGGVAPADKVVVTGHPFCSEEVMERMPSRHKVIYSERKNQVVFSSRFDAEKNPCFFLEVARRVIEEYPLINARFVICTGAPKLRSNYPKALEDLEWSMSVHPKGIILREGLTKEQYYEILCESKVQMNTADQDFVAITLLEASVAGCFPIYPYFRSFPETLRRNTMFMYERLDVDSAVDKIVNVLTVDQSLLWSDGALQKRAWIHERFDTSWKRQLIAMGLMKGTIDDPYEGY